MENSWIESSDHPKVDITKPDLNSDKEQESVINDEKTIDSDTNSKDPINVENNIISNTSSQFYESSDSKIDYAVKIDDNDNDTLSDIEDIKTDSASADSEDSALGSLPPDITLNDREEVPDRSDGSDSGLGSETAEDAKLPNFNLNLPCTSGLHKVKSPTINEDIACNINVNTSNVEENCHTEQNVRTLRSSLKRNHSDENYDERPTKQKKRKIQFNDITVYHFPRAQGFICVPSQGGSTLGMEWMHTHVQKFTLAEHAMEQRRLHRQILQQLRNERHNMQSVVISSSEDSDTEEETSDISESELDLDSYYFLQPVPTRQRRALLRAAGVRKIEAYEKDECKDIRTSREFCGCACKGVCDPENCSCSQAGIKCQVDRLSFPCGCSRDGCGNTTGRVEFNPVRVRTHFIHTLMRVTLEKKNENQEAANRQWSTLQKTNISSCTTNSLYQSEQCNEDSLLKDVNLTSSIEVESCVSSGSFNNVHCESNNRVEHGTSANMQENVNYNYGNDNTNHTNETHNNMAPFDKINTCHNHCDSYASKILQCKASPFTASNGVGFETPSSNFQRFPCDLNYTYDQQPDDQNFNGMQSFSATRFEEFAQSSQMSMFNHYSHMYIPDYFNKPNTSTLENNSLHYYDMSQNHYQMYKTDADCANVDNKSMSDYTTLMSLPYQNSSKLRISDNDENWFSHNTLLNLDQTDQTTQDAPDLQYQTPQAPVENNASEVIENFGELIKKTMVESVIV